MTDMLQLFKLVDQLSPDERKQLVDYLQEGKLEDKLDIEVQIPPNKIPGQRILGLHPGAIWTSKDFDDPLPDEFWLGTDADSK